MGLDDYRRKRDFTKTSEPAPGKRKPRKNGHSFCVQKHDATRLHYDFRLEMEGVLKSWAVTRGPSLDPKDKRLAVRTEDHPLAYGGFEGTIPAGEYGGGTVMLWDRGDWTPHDEDPLAALEKGHLSFSLDGERLKGSWALIRMRGRGNDKRENWLLVKEKDKESRSGAKAEKFLEANAYSVKTGRKMEEIAEAAAPRAAKGKSAPRKSAATRKAALRKGNAPGISALRKSYPDVQLATLVTAPPQGGDWLHEMKYDGYRIICYKSGGRVAIHTRNGNDWTDRFPAVASALAALKVDSAVLDGEAVVIGEKGVTSFYGLQEALGEKGDVSSIQAYFFDILHLNGQDTAAAPLRERKELLRLLLARAKPPLYYSAHVESSPGLLAQACAAGMEGLISKRADARYSAGRTKSWVKSKCNRQQEFIVLGYTASKSGPRSIGALHIGYYKDGALAYAGKVGTGFGRDMSDDILGKLKPLVQDHPPVKGLPASARRGTTWVRPEILCQVTFTEWTPAGLVRHSSFEGLREDKQPRLVVREEPRALQSSKARSAPQAKGKAAMARSRKKSDAAQTVGGIAISHGDRLLFEGSTLTKLDLAAYYAAVAPAMLASLRQKPVSLMRCPEGARKECFFQRNPDDHMKKHVEAFAHKRKGKKHEYLYVRDAAGLVYLSQMGVIEFHAWGAEASDIEHPVKLVFDLDPDTSVPFEAVKLAARDLRKRLKKLGLVSHVKTTGGKGLHVVVPLSGKQDWDTVHSFAEAFARGMAAEVPQAYVATMSKAKRKGKIFIDYFRNDITATSIADYSVRARAGGPVSVPLEWSELSRLKSGNAFDIPAVLKRLKKKKLPRHDRPRQMLPALD